MRRRDHRIVPALTSVSLVRRRLWRWMLLPAAPWLAVDAWAQMARVTSSRLWPAADYTRLIVETNAPVGHLLGVLRNPDRIVLDVNGVDPSNELAQLPLRVQPSDPYIAAIRVAVRSSTAMRVVLELKGEVKPDVFALPPVAEFGHRLVLDLYPIVPLDPLMALLESERAKDKPPPIAMELPPSPPRETPSDKATPPPAPKSVARRLTIAIDPGHGGEDPGAIGRRGTYEKNVTLAIARKLAARVEGDRNMRAMLTRDDDFFVPLRERVAKARRVQADLFISIHADAFREPTARGSSVFALSESGATSAAARWLAQKENQADLIGGVDLDRRDPVLARTLLDLSQTAQISDSLKVGRQVLDGIGTHNPLHKGSVEQAGFAVLKAPDIPSILVETAFISNPEEEMMLRSDRHQKKFADSMYDGITRYFARNPPLARA